MDLIYLIPRVIAEIFNPTAESEIIKGITNKETKAGIDTYTVIVERRISSYSLQLKVI